MASKEAIASFMETEFPQFRCTIEAVGNKSATVIRKIGIDELRPGGTVSGTVLMGVADEAIYVAIFGEIGIMPLAVTTNITINFLRKPPASNHVRGVCNLFKVGKSLAVGEVCLYSDGMDKPVAHAVGTYSIPPSRGYKQI